MKTILISTILRNSEGTIFQYYSQIKNLVSEFSSYHFFISIYENDSVDRTKKILDSLDWSFVDDFSIIKENINTKQFDSVVVEERVKNLANARNKTLEAKNFLQKADYILSIESDIMYDNNSVRKILNFKETNSPDIISAASYIINKNGIKQLYDTWATRQTEHVEYGSLISEEINKYYSTFNCMCLYDAVPFKEGARFHWFNTRLNKFDCDTAVICEEFHKRGYHNIYIDPSAECWHGKKRRINEKN
jgi:hypothetical protein